MTKLSLPWLKGTVSLFATKRLIDIVIMVAFSRFISSSSKVGNNLLVDTDEQIYCFLKSLKKTGADVYRCKLRNRKEKCPAFVHYLPDGNTLLAQKPHNHEAKTGKFFVYYY